MVAISYVRGHKLAERGLEDKASGPNQILEKNTVAEGIHIGSNWS